MCLIPRAHPDEPCAKPPGRLDAAPKWVPQQNCASIARPRTAHCRMARRGVLSTMWCPLHDRWRVPALARTLMPARALGREERGALARAASQRVLGKAAARGRQSETVTAKNVQDRRARREGGPPCSRRATGDTQAERATPPPHLLLRRPRSRHRGGCARHARPGGQRFSQSPTASPTRQHRAHRMRAVKQTSDEGQPRCRRMPRVVRHGGHRVEEDETLADEGKKHDPGSLAFRASGCARRRG